jgi:predicted outer membrane repeat protein
MKLLALIFILIACTAATEARATKTAGEQNSAKARESLSARRAAKTHRLARERLRFDVMQAEHPSTRGTDASEPLLRLDPVQDPGPGGRALLLQAVGANHTLLPFEVSIAGCRATVGEPNCTAIKPCLRAMSADCAVKTLDLPPGIYNGTENVNVGVASSESVALVGAGGAVIDGGGTDWLISVVGNGSLALTNLMLQRAFLPDGSPKWGAALSVKGQGVLNVTGVRFLDNQAADEGSKGGAVSLVDSGVSPTRWLDACFADCTFEYNSCGIYGGGVYVAFVSPSFTRCVWRHNTVVGDHGFGGGLLLAYPSANPGTPPSSLLNCTFNGNNAQGAGGAVFAVSVPGLRFVGVVFLQNEAPAGSGGAVLFEATANSSQILVGFEHCRFDSNLAAKGGGAVSLTIFPAVVGVASSTNDAGAAPPAVCTLLGTSFVDNRATTGAGGAVLAIFPPDAPINLRFLHDNCSGVVCDYPDNPSSNTPPDHVSNTSRTWSRSAVLRLTGIFFQGNSAFTNGGALAVTNGAVVMENAAMKANSAAEYGGALFLDGTTSLSASDTSWVSNIVDVDRLQQDGSAKGQHVYAAAGAGEWNFSGSTIFEHANANESGLSAGKMDGAYGLTTETAQESVLTFRCPAGTVVTPPEQRVFRFTAQSGEWRLSPGVTTTTTTGAVFDSSGRGGNGYHQLNSTVVARNNTRCEAEYFANFMCGNPPPVYPPMNYATVSLGCKQCGRSEAALPAEGQISGNSSQCEPCPEAWIGSGSATCDSGHVVQAPAWWRPEAEGTIRVTKDTQFWECYTHEAACLGSANTTAGAPAFDAQCAPGHTGPVCALCHPGFAMVHSVCKPVCKLCPPGAWAAIGSAAALAVSGIGSIAILHYNRKSSACFSSGDASRVSEALHASRHRRST